MKTFKELQKKLKFKKKRKYGNVSLNQGSKNNDVYFQYPGQQSTSPTELDNVNL